MEEKIKITLSKNVLNKLDRDCEKFLFLKPNGDINRNLFFNTLITNYYKHYQVAEEKMGKSIQTILTNHHIKESKDITNEILSYLTNQELDSVSSHTTIVNIKPTKLSSTTIQMIFKGLNEHTTLSAYYRKLFESYAKLPQYYRERIMAKDVYDTAKKAINEQTTVSIFMKNNHVLMNVSLYIIKASTDELYNYLLFETRDKKPGTIRLSKIKSIELMPNISQITNDKLFQKQIYYGIQYPIYSLEEEPVKVKLTASGLKMFKKIYLYRPIVDKIENDIYSFTCSHYQLIYYFKRFGKEAMIISPAKLTYNMKNFYNVSDLEYQKFLEEEILNKLEKKDNFQNEKAK